MRFTGRAFRGHDPGWSFAPLSGDGAAIRGGRFNRPGEPALYLSLDVMTAVAEVSQGFAARLPPLTMCEYDVDAEVADLRDEAARAAAGVARTELECGWLGLMLAGKTPPSWGVAARFRADGACGLLVPSFVPGAGAGNVNLVLWRWGDAPCAVTVWDPGARLPRDRRSWE